MGGQRPLRQARPNGSKQGLTIPLQRTVREGPPKTRWHSAVFQDDGSVQGSHASPCLEESGSAPQNHLPATGAMRRPVCSTVGMLSAPQAHGYKVPEDPCHKSVPGVESFAPSDQKYRHARLLPVAVRDPASGSGRAHRAAILGWHSPHQPRQSGMERGRETLGPVVSAPHKQMEGWRAPPPPLLLTVNAHAGDGRTASRKALLQPVRLARFSHMANTARRKQVNPSIHWVAQVQLART